METIYSKIFGEAKDKKNVTLSDEGEYYCGEHVGGRFYTGKFNGAYMDNQNRLTVNVDDRTIVVSLSTKISFS